MSRIVVTRITLRGVPLIGLRKHATPSIIARFKEMGIGVTYHTSQGIVKGRIDDLKGVPLKPSLHPNGFEQTFVGKTILEKAEKILLENPGLRARIVPAEEPPFNWEHLSFGLTPTDAMFYVKTKAGEQWPDAELVPFDEILISPSAGVLNYGQGLFEGMKAYRSVKGHLVLFRPTENAQRMQEGAKRLDLTPVPTEYFLKAVTQVVFANERWIPPQGKGALYIRPSLIGSGQILGVSSSPENTFIIFVSPVGSYFKEGWKGIKLLVSDNYHRAAPGGTGKVKAIGNYASGILPSKEAKSKGFSELIYLDAQEHKFVEEVNGANFLCVKNGVLYTPEVASSTVLPGITRKSIIQLARDYLGYEVKEEKIPINFVMEAEEAFCSGTGYVICPVNSITWGDRTVVYNNGEIGPLTQKLYETLTGIQEQRIPDPYGWIHIIK